MEDSEDVWDSWEDMADSGVLDKRLEEEKKQHEAQQKLQASIQVSRLQEDTHRTSYQPQLRILKRPTEAAGDPGPVENKGANKTRQKTLAEREEEYKQARLRILGSAETDFSEASPRPSLETKPPREGSTSKSNNFGHSGSAAKR
ncbi:SUZ RNA-binding domain-containing-like [Diadema setosum]|uniref:SUZ RNA-binding domain-containing-like n=1 Tax=Diadema setosum TaxID=31175 RepID=UPI003B3B9FA3